MHTDRPGAAAEHDRWSERLSAYLDGELKSAERARLEAHLAECAACAVALAELREVVARARTLEDRPPATDLWPAIESQLAPRSAPARAPRGRILAGPAWWGRRFELGLPQLAAAAVLLVALSAGAVWLLLRGPAPPGAPGGVPGGPVAGAPAGTPRGSSPAARRTAGSGAIDVSAASLELSNPRYDAAVTELEQALAEGRGRLDPRTLEVVETNLQIIDNAIADARRAVAADPGNTWLRSHLAATMKRKVDLLRSATMLATAQG